MLNFPAIKTALDSSHNIQPSQKVVLEWNYNSSAGISEMGVDDVMLYQWDSEKSNLKLIETSTKYDKYYESMYPLTSICSFIRPGEYAVHNNQYVGGIVKALFGNITSGIATYKHTEAKRNYFVSKDAGYKYWAAIRRNDSSTAINKSVYVVYDREIKVNKLVVKFETAHSIPSSYKVYTQAGGTWTLAYESNTPLTNGGLALYYNGTAWTTTKHTNPSIDANTRTITGIKVLVPTINTGYVPLEIIEVSPRLEVEITSEVVNWNVQKTMFEDHEILPVGYISSNSASVTFDNTYNSFSYENTTAKYYGMLDKRVGVKIYSIINSTEIPQFTGFIDSWSVEPDSAASVQCYDMAKVLQQTQCADMVIGPDTEVGKFARIMFDSVGINELTIDVPSDSKETVKLFWMSNEQTFWEALQEFCISHQCVAYFDEYGRAVFKSRERALEATTTEQILTYETSNGVLPNILSISQQIRPRIGKLVIKYAGRSYDTQNDIQTTYKIATENPKSADLSYRSTTFADTIWQPEAGWTLGAAPLKESIGLTDTTIKNVKPTITPYINKETGATEFNFDGGLPSFSGYFFINGEIIYYGATNFTAIFNDGTPVTTVPVASREEYNSYIASNPGLVRFINTGELVQVKRGEFGTTAKAHTAASTSTGWNTYQFKIGSTTKTTIGEPKFSVSQRSLKLVTNNVDTNTKKLAEQKFIEERRKSVQVAVVPVSKNNYRRFETNVKFSRPAGADLMSGELDSIGGIFFDYNPDNNSGYFVEVGLEETTANMVVKSNPQNLKENKSILIYKLLANGTRQILGFADAPKNLASKYIRSESIYKDSVSFNTNTNYDIQVARYKSAGSNWINLYVMGQLILQAEDKSPLAGTTNAGVFVRGDTTAEFSKFAAWDAGEGNTLDQDDGFMADSVLGFMTNVIAQGYLSAPSKSSQVNKVYDFHEFYPMMREIRIAEFDYTKAPATPIKISAGAAISSYGAVILEATSFRGKIAAINESSYPVDLFSAFPGGQPAQYPKLLGYTLKKYENRDYTVTISDARVDDAKFELDSEWIQSLSEAKSIATFIKNNSAIEKNGKTNDSIIVQADIFSNPLLQLGDTVDIIYPALGLNSGTHSFIITGIDQSFSDGITTNIRLQEVSNGI